MNNDQEQSTTTVEQSSIRPSNRKRNIIIGVAAIVIVITGIMIIINRSSSTPADKDNGDTKVKEETIGEQIASVTAAYEKYMTAQQSIHRMSVVLLTEKSIEKEDKKLYSAMIDAAKDLDKKEARLLETAKKSDDSSIKQAYQDYNKVLQPVDGLRDTTDYAYMMAVISQYDARLCSPQVIPAAGFSITRNKDEAATYLKSAKECRSVDEYAMEHSDSLGPVKDYFKQQYDFYGKMIPAVQAFIDGASNEDTIRKLADENYAENKKAEKSWGSALQVEFVTNRMNAFTRFQMKSQGINPDSGEFSLPENYTN